MATANCVIDVLSLFLTFGKHNRPATRSPLSFQPQSTYDDFIAWRVLVFRRSVEVAGNFQPGTSPVRSR